MDEVIAVRVTGLRASQHITLRATTLDSAGRVWQAGAEFAADTRGEVDTRRAPALRGAYRGVDPMGLVAAMDLPQTPGVARYLSPSLSSVPLTFTASIGDRIIDSAVVRRSFLGPRVRMSLLKRDGLVGTFFQPIPQGRVPGILVLGGSEGGNSAADVAAQLAAHGYATL